MAIVQIQGYTFWLNFLPAIWRARLLAESVRQSYQGAFPWGSQQLGMEDRQPGWELQMQLPDGQCWLLRPVEGPEPPAKARVLRFVERHWIGRLSWVRAAAAFVDWLRSWLYEIRLMRGTSPFAHWTVKQVALLRLPPGA